ncbi:uncharacterized protein LOC142771453 [Rhipicephalus microplus]|uniref:uncharacterized protein LOC142771453 n=1 Tax=Rhipicephalus microplus TaxID=6941 RepID=UPI003F6B33D0
MYLQVLLFAVVGQLSSASSDGLPTTVTEDSGVCSGTPLSSFSAHHSPFFRVSDGLPPNLDFTVFAVRQHGATSADPPLQKRAGCIDTSGHGTAVADRRSPIMYLQVLLFAVVGQLSSASSDGLPTTVTEDSGVCSGTPLSSFSTHHSPFFRVSDGLPPNLDFTVFAVRQHGATSADPPLQKRAGCIDTSGHGTAAADRRSPIMYLQVLLFAVVGQLSSASSDGLPTTVTEDSGVCSGTPLSSFSAHHSPFFRVSDGLPPSLDFTVFAVRQHGATSSDPPLQKRAGCIDTSGHGTAAADRRSPIMYLQVLLFAVVGQLSSASSDGLPTTVTEDSGVCSGTPLSSFSAHHSPFFRVSDGLPPNLDFTVFAVRQHGATSADPPLQKRAGCIDTSGHGTAAADRRSPIMYLQVLLFAVVGQLSSASSDGLPTTVTEDSGVCSGTPLSSFSAHHSPFFRVSDGLPPNLDFTVFAVRQHGATSADPPLQKRAGCIDTSGHGTAAADRRSPIMYLQWSRCSHRSFGTVCAGGPVVSIASGKAPDSRVRKVGFVGE